MRISLLLLTVFGVSTPLAAQAPPSSPLGSRPVPLVSSELSGAQLFHHQWTRDIEAEQTPTATKKVFLAQWGALRGSGLRSGLAQEAENPRILLNKGDGLGPLHNATSCADCHRGGGASGVKHNVTLITLDPRSPALKRPSMQYAQQLLDVFPNLLNEFGNLSIEMVVHDRSTRYGYNTIRAQLAKYVPGGIDDAWFVPEKRTIEAIAAQPVVAGRHAGVDFYLSQRNAPPLFGLGLIDQIHPVTLTNLAEQQAKKTNGQVTGRVASKFGWRGQIPTLAAFVSQACAGELGLSQLPALQAGDPADLEYTPPGLDMTVEDVEKLTQFVSSLPKPIEGPQPQHTHDDVYDGESLFNSVGCVVCHVPDVRPVQNLFSDLLLHDMGERLQAASPAPPPPVHSGNTLRLQLYPKHGPTSGTSPPYYSASGTSASLPAPEQIARPMHPQFPRGARPSDTMNDPTIISWDALQREWRTPPLWGIADTGPYLHDGRAETLEQAILWHGGEAQSSRDGYAALKPAEKKQLLAFLSSLRAPGDSKAAKARETAE